MSHQEPEDPTRFKNHKVNLNQNAILIPQNGHQAQNVFMCESFMEEIILLLYKNVKYRKIPESFSELIAFIQKLKKQNYMPLSVIQMQTEPLLIYLIQINNKNKCKGYQKTCFISCLKSSQIRK